MEIKVFADADSVARGGFVMAVSGGHTPWLMLRALAREDLPWGAVQMALAPLIYTIWNRVLRFDPENPICPIHDRFVLSNGYASMLLWAEVRVRARSGSRGRKAATRHGVNIKGCLSKTLSRERRGPNRNSVFSVIRRLNQTRQHRATAT